MEQKATTNNQEIDLSYLYTSVRDFLENIVYGFFKVISCFLRNIVITCIVLIIGIGLGIYVDKNDKKAYKSIVVVATNFFFSSRRRHTRWTGDWSSDVCSSD